MTTGQFSRTHCFDCPSATQTYDASVTFTFTVGFFSFESVIDDLCTMQGMLVVQRIVTQL
jgi:hypothetical protein